MEVVVGLDAVVVGFEAGVVAVGAAVFQFSLQPEPWQLQYWSWVPPCPSSTVSHLNLEVE